MNLRIARKICRYMGYGYPIDNIGRLEEAIRIWTKASHRFKHFKRDVQMQNSKPKYKPNEIYKLASWYKKHNSLTKAL